MDARRFDALARALTDRLPRRAMLGLGAAVLAGALGLHDAMAKKKKNTKRKKKCKGETKKCGKTCIPKSNCCWDGDCDHGNFFHCINGVCDCLADGWKSCGNTCVQEHQCCDDADCQREGLHVCVDNFCQCSGFFCQTDCCAPNEVCHYSARQCVAGSCPDVDFCYGGDQMVLCGPHGEGLCTGSISGATECILDDTVVCMDCTSDQQCKNQFGSSWICADDVFCFCRSTGGERGCVQAIPGY